MVPKKVYWPCATMQIHVQVQNCSHKEVNHSPTPMRSLIGWEIVTDTQGVYIDGAIFRRNIHFCNILPLTAVTIGNVPPSSCIDVVPAPSCILWVAK